MPQSRKNALAMGVTALIAFPFGYAIAGAEDNPEPPPPEVLPLEEPTGSNEPKPSNPEGKNFVGEGQPNEQSLARCQKEERPEWCDVILAMAEGAIEPGYYTDAELSAALRAAGYSGGF